MPTMTTPRGANLRGRAAWLTGPRTHPARHTTAPCPTRVSAYLRERLDLAATGHRATPGTPRVTRWILSRPETLTEIEQLRLKAVLANCSEIDALNGHARSFAVMSTERHGDNSRGRRTRQQDQDAQAPDVRPSRFQPATEARMAGHLINHPALGDCSTLYWKSWVCCRWSRKILPRRDGPRPSGGPARSWRANSIPCMERS